MMWIIWPKIENIENKNVLLWLFVFLALWTAVLFYLPKDDLFAHRMGGNLFSLAVLYHCIIFACNFDRLKVGYQFITHLELLPEYGINLSLGLDGISMALVLLTAFISSCCVFICTYTMDITRCRPLLIKIFLIEFCVLGAFCVTNLFFFFVFFESVLIPMFLMIGDLGSRRRKINAGFYFFLYTLGGSFFLFYGIISLFQTVGSLEYQVLCDCKLSSENQLLWFVCFFLPFAIKIPMFPFHIWLPEAHVEAPTIGSVILASLLLKLGAYGFLRFTLPIFPVACVYYQPIVVSLALIGFIYASFAAFRQLDLKRIIAYSSIGHMNLIVLGIFTFTHQGIEGAIYLMIAHGLTSGGLFFCIGTLYDRFHTRSLKHYGGLQQVMPLFSIAFLLFSLANMSFPGTSNFVGELLLFTGMFQNNSWIIGFATTGVIFSAIYSIWLYNRICGGTLKNAQENVANYADLNRPEFYIFFVLLVAIFFLGLYSGILTDLTILPIKKILSRFK